MAAGGLARLSPRSTAGGGKKYAGTAGQIEGRAQRTGTLGHEFTSYSQALEMAQSGLYERIYLNRAYSTVAGVRTSPRRLPDVIGKRLTGELDVVEILSRTDRRPAVNNRNHVARNQLPANMRGDINIVDDLGRHYTGIRLPKGR
ncbi:MAG: hypothetical protein KF754_12190 [Planctomycetes bacterium]|nr:hypothetical protein [Planctomycetota bacterium]